MRRFLGVVTIACVGLGLLGAPSSAAPVVDPLNRAVSGSFVGRQNFEFGTHGCSFVHQEFTTTYTADGGGTGSFFAEGCVSGGDATFSYDGTFRVTTPDGAVLAGTATGGIDADGAYRLALAVINGLWNGREVRGSIRAVGTFSNDPNVLGHGPTSGQLTGSLVAQTEAPGAPTAVTAVAHDGQVTVSWQAPASNGGSPITGYTVTPFVGVAQPSQTSFSTATTRTITGVTNGAAYTFTVTAINAVGPGPTSAPSNPVVPAGPPGAPTIGTATAGLGEVTLRWTAPLSDGGDPIIAYLVTPYVGGVAQPTRRFGSPGTQQTVTGLSSGTRYTFRVAAANGVGPGRQSIASNAVAPK